MKYWVVTFKDSKYKDFDSFSSFIEASEFINKKIKDYKKVGYRTEATKYKKFKDVKMLQYALMRNKVKHNVSFTIIKTPKNDLLEETILNDKKWGNLASGRRHNVVLRVNDEELDILNELSKKYDVKISTIIRASLLNTIGKDIK